MGSIQSFKTELNGFLRDLLIVAVGSIFTAVGAIIGLFVAIATFIGAITSIIPLVSLAGVFAVGLLLLYSSLGSLEEVFKILDVVGLTE